MADTSPAAGSTPKKKISSHLMGMKFMQRRQEAELRKKLAEEQKQAAEKAKWEVAGASATPTVTVMYESTVEGLTGRRSFSAFNPTVERMYEEQTNTRKPVESESESEAEEVDPAMELEGMSTHDAARLSGKKRKSSDADLAASENFYKRKKKRRKSESGGKKRAKSDRRHSKF